MKLLPPFVGVPEVNKVYNVDALTLLRALPSGSVDAFITDLPYGTTACSWDEIIPFAPMWAEVKRTLKPRGAFVTTASQPFTSKLVMSNPNWFKYSWVWDKVAATGYQIVKYTPMRNHEDVVVFGEGSVNYYPQMTKASKPRKSSATTTSKYLNYTPKALDPYIRTHEYPKTIIQFSNADHTDMLHPTEKPIALFEYLIATYTQTDNLVVDFCCGSGTTAIAARNLGRAFIASDVTAEYVDVARKRLAQAYTPLLFAELSA